MIGIILHFFGKLLAALISFLVGVIVVIAFSPAWAGIGLLGSQILLWLNTGTWSSFRLADGIDIIAADLGFMNQLKDLYGIGESLRNLLNLIPLSSFLIIAGLLSSAAIAYIYDRLRDRLRENKEEPSESYFVPTHVPSAAIRPLIHYPIQGEDWIRPPRHYPPRINEPSSNPLVENQTSSD
jgi:hypothetical protein